MTSFVRCCGSWSFVRTKLTNNLSLRDLSSSPHDFATFTAVFGTFYKRAQPLTGTIEEISISEISPLTSPPYIAAGQLSTFFQRLCGSKRRLQSTKRARRQHLHTRTVGVTVPLSLSLSGFSDKLYLPSQRTGSVAAFLRARMQIYAK